MNGHTQEGRAALLARGFEPILIEGKAPCVGKDWQAGAITFDRLESWERQHGGMATGTGLRTGKLVAVDIDLWEEAQVEEIAQAVEAYLGRTPFKRIGQKGLQLLYRNVEEPLSRVMLRGAITGGPAQDSGRKRTLVEIMGQGGQIAAYGIHPDTGEPFYWPEENPLDAKLEDLPEANRSQLRKLADIILDRLEELGAENVRKGGDHGDPIPVASRGEDYPVTPDQFRAMFACLDPDDYIWDEWGGWLGLINEAPLVDRDGQEVEDFDRLAFADEWSSGAMGDFEPSNYAGSEDVRDNFNRMSRGSSSNKRKNLGTLINEARANGYAGPTFARTAEEVEAKYPPSVIAAYYRGQGLQVIEGGAARKLEPEEVEETEERRPFKLRSETEQDRAPDPVWLIPGVLQEETLALFYGPENSFKSFLVLDLALSAAAGLPWASYGAKPDAGGYPPSRPLTVVYVAGEGSRAIEKVRRPAWRASRGVDQPLSFYTVEAMPEFRDPAQVEALVEEIETAGVDPDVIVIDTLARAMTGLDENSAKDTGILVAGLDHLKRRFRCSVIGVHHSGKDAQKGARGSTNLPASFDARFAVSADRAALVGYIRNEKQKDGEPLEGRLVFKGHQERGSLVFRCEPPAPGAGMSKDDERVEEVRAALAAMGADERLIATNWLAEKIVETRLEKDPAVREKTTDQDRDRMLRNESRNLQRQVKDRADGSPGFLRQFIVGATEGGDLSWTLPQVEDGED